MSEHILKIGEFVHLRDNVKVHVLRIECDRVRLGFEAPRHVIILRGELVGRSPQPDDRKRGAA